MLIALVNPPDQADSYYDSGYCCIHLGIAYIAAALEAVGHQVDIYECFLNNINTKDLISRLLEKEYDAIGFTTYYFNILQVYRIAQKIKKKSDVFIYLGGIFASMNYSEILEKKYINCCCLGEGEETVVDLMKCIHEKNDLSTVDGIAYRLNGEVVLTNKRRGLANLDQLAFPKRTYFFKGHISSMIASRGCNGNCSFCGITNYYREFTTRKIRVRSPKNVVDEIERMVIDNHVDYIYFQDENFFSTILIQKDWLAEFSKEILRRELKIRFYAYARADDLLNHTEEVDLLKEVGLDCVFVGVESFVERQLRLYDKHTNPSINRKLIEFIKEKDLNFNMGLILFDPYVTLEELRVNLDNMLSTGFYEKCYFSQTPSSCLGPLYPMQHTKFYDTLIENDMYDDSIFHKYRFANDEIEVLYHRLDDWRSMVIKVYEDIDTQYKMLDDTIKEDFDSCLRRLRNLLKLDVEYMKDLTYINYFSDEKHKELLDQYQHRLEEI